MQHRTLGTSSLSVSVVGLGGNNFGGRLDVAATRRVVHRALDLGVTLIDTAETYGEGRSEEFIGAVLGPRRNDVVLASKFGLGDPGQGKHGGASRQSIIAALEGSLKRLRTDWIDLYQMHRPDPVTPIEVTLRALDELVRTGKVRHVGCSNLTAPQIVEAQDTAARHGLTPFCCAQDQYSLLARGVEHELLPVVESSGLGFLPYFPLASGLLTGKYQAGAIPKEARLAYSKRHADRFISDRNWAIVGKLEAFCAQRGRRLIELAFAWLLARPCVAGVIAGASTAEQVAENVAAVGWVLSAEELAEVDRITGADELHPQSPSS